MRDHVFDKYFAGPVLEYYPHAEVSDYGRMPGRAGRWFADPEMLRLIERKAFYLDGLEGVGNRSAIVLYGSGDPKDDSLGVMIELLDFYIDQAGDARLVTPWITAPNWGLYSYDYKTKELTKNPEENRRLTDAEWEEMILTCVRRGVRRFILWNTPRAGHDQGNCDATMVKVFEKASRLAERLDKENRL